MAVKCLTYKERVHFKTLKSLFIISHAPAKPDLVTLQSVKKKSTHCWYNRNAKTRDSMPISTFGLREMNHFQNRLNKIYRVTVSYILKEFRYTERKGSFQLYYSLY